MVERRPPKPEVEGSSPSSPALNIGYFDMFSKIGKYFFEVKKELGKVSWLNRQELRGSTIVVLVFCLILVLFLFVIDLVIVTIRNQVY